jgi:uncharacterized protein (UPF0305 family)
VSRLTRSEAAAEEFANATKKLMEALPKSSQKSLKDLKVPAFETTDSAEATVQKLDEFFETFARTRRTYKTDPRRSVKAKRIARKWFIASVPYMQKFLQDRTRRHFSGDI